MGWERIGTGSAIANPYPKGAPYALVTFDHTARSGHGLARRGLTSWPPGAAGGHYPRQASGPRRQQRPVLHDLPAVGTGREGHRLHVHRRGVGESDVTLQEYELKTLEEQKVVPGDSVEAKEFAAAKARGGVK